MITFATAKGKRPYQEDRFLGQSVPDGTLLGVFDGHGGAEVAQILADKFPKIWSAFDGLDYLQTLTKAFAMAHSITFPYPEGSTASVVLITRDESEAYIAVLGDSPVLAERADGTIFVGPDHNARSNAEECSKAITRGGIYYSGYVWNDYSDNASGLQMTRAFGDKACDNFLDRTPEVFRIPLGNFLLVASDGLIDPTHTKKTKPAVSLGEKIRAGATAGQLVKDAEAVPTNDNVTAVLWRRE